MAVYTSVRSIIPTSRPPVSLPPPALQLVQICASTRASTAEYQAVVFERDLVFALRGKVALDCAVEPPLVRPVRSQRQADSPPHCWGLLTSRRLGRLGAPARGRRGRRRSRPRDPAGAMHGTELAGGALYGLGQRGVPPQGRTRGLRARHGCEGRCPGKNKSPNSRLAPSCPSSAHSNTWRT